MVSGTRKVDVVPLALEPPQGGYHYSGYNSLGCLVAYAKQHKGAVLGQVFEFGKIVPIPHRDQEARLRDISNDPSVAMLSCYVWSFDVNMAFAKSLKERQPGALVVVGGAHVPRAQAACEAFFVAHPYVDVAVRNEGEVTFAELLVAIADREGDPVNLTDIDFGKVNGLTFRRGSEIVRTPDRPRTKDLSIFPSPFLTGEFDSWFDGLGMIPIETNRGCPYGCTFCDWGAATLSKVNRMSMERVEAEIEYAADRRTTSILFCDANFGILPRDVDIAKHVIKTRDRFDFPKRVAYATAKTVTPRVREIIQTVYESGLTDIAPISMQTTDPTTLDVVERSNIKMDEHHKLISFLQEKGIPTNSDMMVGLPGQTFDSVKKDLQFFFDHNILAVHHRTSVMPNAPLADAEYRRKYDIVVSDDGFVESCYSFSEKEHETMLALCLAYKFFVKMKVLKYFLFFVQMEHGVKAMDFAARWIEKVTSGDAYPVSRQVWTEMLNYDRSIIGGNDWLMVRWSDEQAAFLFDNMEAFQAEIVTFIEREHGVRLTGSTVEAVLKSNREIMPRKGRELPNDVELEHDVVSYFKELHDAGPFATLPHDKQPLERFGPGVLQLVGPARCRSYDFLDARPGASALAINSDLVF